MNHAPTRILIAGSGGYLGSYLRQLYPGAATPQVNIADRAAVSRMLDSTAPDVVINAAGKTGRPNIEWCETHRSETLESNLIGPLTLQEECHRRGIYFVHLSTGCIFQGNNGTEGYREDDRPNFFGSYYSLTKGYADQILLQLPVLLLRLRMPFDGSSNPRNLIIKLRSYTHVVDAQNSLTYLPDFQRAIAHLVAERTIGCFHVVNPETISPCDIMDMYRQLVESCHAFRCVTKEEFERLVVVPRSNCTLCSKKLSDSGCSLQPVRLAVKESLLALRHLHNCATPTIATLRSAILPIV